MKRDTDQTSRVLMIVISAENSERNRVDQLMDIVEAQVRGIFKTVAVTQDENHRLALPPKLELQVYA